MLENCIFCRIIRGEIPSYNIYEDEKTFAFLDINPSALGHTLIIPKVHESRIEDLSKEDATALFGVMHQLVAGIQEAMGAPASSIGINNGPEAGQEVPHVHIHVIPRTKGDRGEMIQGLVHTAGSPRGETMQNITERIREHTLYPFKS